MSQIQPGQIINAANLINAFYYDAISSSGPQGNGTTIGYFTDSDINFADSIAWGPASGTLPENYPDSDPAWAAEFGGPGRAGAASGNAWAAGGVSAGDFKKTYPSDPDSNYVVFASHYSGNGLPTSTAVLYQSAKNFLTINWCLAAKHVLGDPNSPYVYGPYKASFNSNQYDGNFADPITPRGWADDEFPGSVANATYNGGGGGGSSWAKTGSLSVLWNQFMNDYAIANSDPYAVGTFGFATQFTIPSTDSWSVYVSADNALSITLTNASTSASYSYSGIGNFQLPDPMNITPSPVPLTAGTVINVTASYTNPDSPPPNPGGIAVRVLNAAQTSEAWSTLTYLSGGGGGGGGESTPNPSNQDYWGINNYFNSLKKSFNSRPVSEVSITVCHVSCHSSCHGSRGRR